jgi:hypothetical protein
MGWNGRREREKQPIKSGRLYQLELQRTDHYHSQTISVNTNEGTQPPHFMKYNNSDAKSDKDSMRMEH